MTQDLNPMGFSFRATYELELGTHVRVPLRLTTGSFEAEGEVVRVTAKSSEFGTVFVHGVQFAELPIETRDAIELHCTHHAVPLWRTRYRQSVPIFAHAFERLSEMRFGKRRKIQLPVLVKLCDADESHCQLGMGLLEEMSDSGARLILENPIEPGARVTYDVPGTEFTGTGTVVFNRAFESPANVRFAVGVQRDRSDEIRLARPSTWRWPFAARVSSA
jgi:hypothetical protein